MSETEMRELQRAADCAGLEMEFLELRADAERYRWIRDNGEPHEMLANHNEWDHEKYDATIDFARAA
jgi:hypothetical protein